MDKEAAIRKINSLLKFTVENGVTVDEAATASAIAHKLMKKYDIIASDLSKDKKLISFIRPKFHFNDDKYSNTPIADLIFILRYIIIKKTAVFVSNNYQDTSTKNDFFDMYSASFGHFGGIFEGFFGTDWFNNNKKASFTETLLHFIDSKGKTDSEVYRKANIDRRHFSKIRNHPDYRPTKSTIFAFAIALELSLDETKQLLESAGFSLSHSFKQDLVIEFFIKEKLYDLNEINIVLHSLKLPLLGG